MSHTLTREKFPKKPEYNKILEGCKKDFKRFKQDSEEAINGHIESQIKENTLRSELNTVLTNQKETLDTIRQLIQEGKEDIAFSLFFRTFPSCLPHRMRNL